MGVGIVAPKKTFAALTQELHLSNRRMSCKYGKILKIIGNNLIIETGSGGISSKACKTNDYGTKLLIENARKISEDRRVSIQNGEKVKITEKKYVMEHAI